MHVSCVFYLCMFSLFSNLFLYGNKASPVSAAFYSFVPAVYTYFFLAGKFGKRKEKPNENASLYFLKMAHYNGCRNFSECSVTKGIGLLSLILSGILWHNVLRRNKSMFSTFSAIKASSVYLFLFAFEMLHNAKRLPSWLDIKC
jgi:hypothetical protein